MTTPDTVETRLGTLRFFDGMPDEATVQRLSRHRVARGDGACYSEAGVMGLLGRTRS